MPDTRATRIFVSVAVAGLFYCALFTGNVSAPEVPVAPAGMDTDVAKDLVAEARTLIGSGDHAKALDPALELHDAFPSSPIYVEQLAAIYHKLNRPKEEAESWEEYLVSSPTPAQACPHVGLAYRAQGNEDRARDAFARCLAFDSDNPDAILYLALAEERAGMLKEAAEHYARGLTLVPDYPDLRLGLARIGLRTGRVAESKATALLVLRTHPDNTDALLVAGLACLRTGDLTEARRYLERGLELSPGNSELAEALARVDSRLGRADPPGELR